MRYLYEIAGIRILCEIPFPVQREAESAEFFRSVPADCRADLKFIICPAQTLPVMPEEGHWEINRYYIETSEEQCVYHCPARTMPPYACVVWPGRRTDIVSCDYVQGMESYMDRSHNLCDLIGLETLLMRYGGLMLHAAFVRWQEKGILFTAPSGTGKSTQANLWAKYEGAEILNGDRAGLRCMEGRWTAFGLPLAGSSYIYRNESAPADTIVVLRQSPENRIRRLGPAEAFRYLYPEVTVHQWHRPWVEKASSMLLDLISHVPVWLLECRPDQGAVRLLKETIMERQKEGD